MHSFIGRFLYVPWPGIKPATLVYWGNTNKLSYPARAVPFICFRCLVVVARTADTLLVRSEESGNPCFLKKIYWFERERERNITSLSHLSVHSLVAACRSPEWGLNRPGRKSLLCFRCYRESVDISSLKMMLCGPAVLEMPSITLRNFRTENSVCLVYWLIRNA